MRASSPLASCVLVELLIRKSSGKLLGSGGESRSCKTNETRERSESLSESRRASLVAHHTAAARGLTSEMHFTGTL